jgi:FKBP-type peptidyl-prolyl cis-trans isomerase SlyD
MKIAKDSVVAIEYRLHLGDGEVVDESEPGDPLEYLHGHDEIVPGLEQALEGKGIGENLKITVAPKDGYGDHDPEGIEEVPRSEFPADMELEPGAIGTTTTDDDEEIDFLVKEIKGDTIVIDFNHPFAGKTLHFDVTVRGVRPATKEELEHGHAHGEDGHEH